MAGVDVREAGGHHQKGRGKAELQVGGQRHQDRDLHREDLPGNVHRTTDGDSAGSPSSSQG